MYRHNPYRTLRAVLCAGLCACSLSAAPTLRMTPFPANVFPGGALTVTVHVAAAAPCQGKLAWELLAADALVERGESSLDLSAPGEVAVRIVLPLPAARSDADIAALLRVSLLNTGVVLMQPFRIIGAEPWRGQIERIRQLDILLFDPENTTALLLEQAGLPFERLYNLDTLPAPGRLLLVGEGVSFLNHRGLPELLLRAAATGPVICLAPREGAFVLPTAGLRRPRSLRLAGRSLVTEMDKHLERDLWGTNGASRACGLHVTCDAGQMTLQCEPPSEDGWSWLEILYADGRLLMTGYAVMARWDQTPAARRLFLRMLERTADPAWSGGNMPLTPVFESVPPVVVVREARRTVVVIVIAPEVAGASCSRSAPDSERSIADSITKNDNDNDNEKKTRKTEEASWPARSAPGTAGRRATDRVRSPPLFSNRIRHTDTEGISKQTKRIRESS